MTSHSELDNTPQSSLGADYEPADYEAELGDGYEEDDDYYYDDDEGDDQSDYSEGYQDGFMAGVESTTLRYRLTEVIPYSIRRKYHALRRRLFPNNSDIPF